MYKTKCLCCKKRLPDYDEMNTAKIKDKKYIGVPYDIICEDCADEYHKNRDQKVSKPTDAVLKDINDYI